MNHLKMSLSKLTAVATVIGVAACASSPKSQSSTPISAQTSTSGSDAYGSTMGQSEGMGSPSAMSGDGGGAAPSGMSAGSESYGSRVSGGSENSSSTASGSDAMGSAHNTATGASESVNQPGGVSGTTGPQASSSAQTGSGGSAGTTSTLGGSPDLSGLTDAQLAAVVSALNDGEIQAAQLAQTKATAPAVKRFAQQMVTDHRAMQNKASAALSRQQITPVDNAISSQIKTDAKNELSSLQGETGSDFNRDYIDAQVRDHNHALELIDRMIPDVKSTELKAQLQSARSKVEHHLHDAERLQQNKPHAATDRQRSSSHESVNQDGNSQR